MVQHVLSVCIFCFICATHSPCASHATVDHENKHRTEENKEFSNLNHPPLLEFLNSNLSEKSNAKNPVYQDNRPISNSKNNLLNNSVLNDDIINKSALDDNYIKKIFDMYGDGESMTMEGFKNLLHRLDHSHVEFDTSLSRSSVNANISSTTETTVNLNNSHSSLDKIKCVNREELVGSLISTPSSSNLNKSKLIDNFVLKEACPAILYSMVAVGCSHDEMTHIHITDPDVPPQFNLVHVLMYSTLAVFIISACGILGIAIIPVTQKWFYQPMIQFLVALAVGTLSGDALLHLLPHAMMSGGGHESHVHSHASEGSEDENVWKGFVAMLGIIFFFFIERATMLLAKWRKSKQVLKIENSRVKVIKQESQAAKLASKQCIDKYSSFPLCYNEIINGPNRVKIYGDPADTDTTATTILDDLGSDSDLNSFKKSHSCNHKFDSHENSNDLNSACAEANVMLKNDRDDVDYTVILREHESRHHGHSHSHGHVHAAPKDMSSVAWMVIMGDGLHNFTDGMAIGAAFSGSIAGGFSTAVAVFCHELPHELGDFAVLLQAGMTMKQALFYNLLSSVLCIFGNFAGIWLGNIESASGWVFAAAAGMFIYIALVDMIPELSSAHKDEGNLVQFCLHLGGLVLGVSIMTVIAIYEHDLKNIFHDQM